MTISGMGMMMKSMGIDPEEIKANIELFMEQMKSAINEVKQNQIRLESKQDLILTSQQHFNLLIGHLIDTGSTTLVDGIAISDEKFPQVVIDAANEKEEKSDTKNQGS